MLLSVFQWLSESVRAFGVFNYLSLRALMAALTAMAIGSLGDSALACHANRAGRALVRPQNAFSQRRNADDGGCADSREYRDFNTPMDGSIESLCVDCALCDALLWPDRVV